VLIGRAHQLAVLDQAEDGAAAADLDHQRLPGEPPLLMLEQFIKAGVVQPRLLGPVDRFEFNAGGGAHALDQHVAVGRFAYATGGDRADLLDAVGAHGPRMPATASMTSAMTSCDSLPPVNPAPRSTGRTMSSSVRGPSGRISTSRARTALVPQSITATGRPDDGVLGTRLVTFFMPPALQPPLRRLPPHRRPA
jgi:hypothetical protein